MLEGFRHRIRGYRCRQVDFLSRTICLTSVFALLLHMMSGNSEPSFLSEGVALLHLQ